MTHGDEEAQHYISKWYQVQQISISQRATKDDIDGLKEDMEAKVDGLKDDIKANMDGLKNIIEAKTNTRNFYGKDMIACVIIL